MNRKFSSAVPRSARLVLVAAGVTVLASMLFTLLVFIPHDRARQIENWRVQLELTATEREANLQHAMNDLMADAATIASFPTLQQLAAAAPSAQARRDAEAGKAHLMALLGNAARFNHLENIALVGRDGRVIVGIDSTSPLSAVAMALGESVIRNGRVESRTWTNHDSTTAFVAAPVTRARDGKSVGAAVLTVAADKYLFPIVTAKWLDRRTAETLVAVKSGDSVILASMPKKHPARRLSMQDTQSAAVAAFHGRRGFGEFRDYAGDKVLAVSRVIAGTDWAIVVKIDRGEAMRDVNHEAAATLLTLLALTIAVLGAAYAIIARMRAQHALVVAQEAERTAHADEELRRSYALLRSLTEATPDAIFVKDTEHRFMFANSACAAIANCGAEAFIGKGNREVFPGNIAVVFDQFDNDVVAHGSSIQREQLIERDGDVRTMLVIGSPLFTDAGDLKGLVGIARDITELKEAQTRFRSIFENSAMGMGMASGQGILIDVNQHFANMLGYDARELRGVDIVDITAEDDLSAQRDWLKEHQRPGKDIFVREKFYLHKNGSRVRARVGGTVIRKPDGSPDYFLVMVQDITALYEVERALRETQERLSELNQRARALLDANVVGITISTPEGAVLEANDYYLDMLGYTRAELDAGLVRWIDMTPPEHLAVATRALQEVRSRGSSSPYEKEYVRKDGSRVWVLMGDTMLPGADEHIITYIVDVTAHKKLEEQYLHAQKMEAVGRLAGGVAHDFNNILTAIKGIASLAIDEAQQNPALVQDLTEIERCADRATELTKQLLAFSRRQMLQPKLFDLGELVVQSERMLRRLIGEDVELILDLEEGPNPVFADPAQLEQVVLNLSLNARDAMPQGGDLRIGVRKLYGHEMPANKTVGTDRVVALTVQDSGTGMSEEVQARIFEPFFTTKEQGKGTGLGLATVYGIVEQSKGALAVKSALHRGSVFTVYLPLADEAVAPAMAAPASAARHQPGVVLLVEDDDGVRSLARRAIERKGHRVLEAANPAEALQVAEQHFAEIHLLVTDLVMPGMSGRDLVAKLRKRYGPIEVIFMSGYSAETVDEAGQLEGVFLPKPFTPPQLVDLVNDMVSAVVRKRAAT